MDITWKVTAEDIEAEEICNKFDLNEDEKQTNSSFDLT